ncbi:MAG: CDP-alcohol phosphatidyltransferase family protein [Candidatus Aminicenantales bacterium]
MRLLSQYKKSLKHIEVEEVLDLYFYRPLAFALVKALYPTNITPNQLTIISLFVGILSGICYGFGYHSAIIAGGLFYGLSIVIDCSDGQLARLKQNGTRLGRILDGLIDYFVSLAIYIGIGIGLAPQSGYRMRWFLIGVAALSNFIHSIALDFYRNRFLDFVHGTKNSIGDDTQSFRQEFHRLKRRKRKFLRRAVIWLYLRYSEVQRKLTINWDNGRDAKRFNADDYYKKNRMALRFWTFLGSTTHGTLLIVTSFLNRLDIYFLGIIVGGNIWLAIMFIVQNRIDQRLEQEFVS